MKNKKCPKPFTETVIFFVEPLTPEANKMVAEFLGQRATEAECTVKKCADGQEHNFYKVDQFDVVRFLATQEVELRFFTSFGDAAWPFTAQDFADLAGHSIFNEPGARKAFLHHFQPTRNNFSLDSMTPGEVEQVFRRAEAIMHVNNMRQQSRESVPTQKAKSRADTRQSKLSAPSSQMRRPAVQAQHHRRYAVSSSDR